MTSDVKILEDIMFLNMEQQIEKGDCFLYSTNTDL